MAFGEFEIRQLNLRIPSQRSALSLLLDEAGLRAASDIQEEIDTYVGAFTCDDRLLGGAGLKGNVVKLVAISKEARSESMLNPIMSRVREIAHCNGVENLMVFTKPEYEAVFGSLAFYTVGRSPEAILLESDRRGISSYCAYLRRLEQNAPGESRGVILMNCNPLTHGHSRLIREAARQVDALFIIPVMEDASQFPYAERREMIARDTANLANVTVCDGSPYQISASTFPSYFLKRADDAAKVQCALDLDIFMRHIHPALGEPVRFVGTEPTDPLTSLYNEEMSRALGQGKMVVTERFVDSNNEVISASRLRKCIAAGRLGEALQMAPTASHPYILAEGAATALTSELMLDTKPGLVGPDGNGAHTDMDLALMNRSIAALRRSFPEMALASDSVEDLRKAGVTAETRMLEATGGINTHKGALFSMGLMMAAAMRILALNEPLTPENLKREISVIAREIPRPTGTHGHEAQRKHNAGGALAQAVEGYATLWNLWLPYYRSVKGTENPLHLLLLKIIATLEDTNILHRGGPEGAEYAKTQAAALLENFTFTDLKNLKKEFENRGLSPGGAADMLALTLLADSLTQNN